VVKKAILHDPSMIENGFTPIVSEKRQRDKRKPTPAPGGED
jgi:RecB family endonuclease NucS